MVKIRKDYIPGLPKYKYLTPDEKPMAIVLHETANQTSTLANEVAYVKRNWHNAFFHYVVDDKEAVELADPRYLAWAAGPNANGFTLHIELVRNNGKNFAQAYRNYIDLAVQLAKKWDIPMSFNKGVEGFITHHWVSLNLGGTDHSDPDAWLRTNGISISQLGKDLAAAYKGEEMLTRQQCYHIVRINCGRTASKEELAKYVGKETYAQFFARTQKWGSHQNALKAAKNGTINQNNFMLDVLKSKVKTPPQEAGDFVKLEQDVYVKKAKGK